MLKWLWKMFVRYVIGYYVPPGTTQPAPPRPPSKWDAAEGKIVVMSLTYTDADDKTAARLLEVYVHGLSEDRKLAYCVAKPNTGNFSLTTNWFPESVYDTLVQGIVGPIPEAARINMADVMARRTLVPEAQATKGTSRRPRVQRTPPEPTPERTEPELREIDLPPEPTTPANTAEPTS